MITKYIQSIIFFTLFMVIISIILPSKKYKSYLDFVLGLVLVSIVITPFTEILFGNNEPINFYNSLDVSVEANDYIETYEKKQNEIINTQFENHLIQQIVSICENEFETTVKNVDIDLDDRNISKINIILNKTVNIDNLKNRLSLSYNLSSKHIDIYIEE